MSLSSFKAAEEPELPAYCTMSDTPPLALTTPEGLSTYLGGDGIAVQCLSGGTANYVYRVTNEQSQRSVYSKSFFSP